MMLTVYGSPLCPDCRECKTNFEAHGIPFQYVDITESMRNLKAFLKLRDHLPVFDRCKEIGSVGIPAICKEDGAVLLDWEKYLREVGLPVIYREARPTMCSIDGKTC